MTVTALDELRAHPQWVVWRYQKRDGKPTKVPYDAKTGAPASSTDPATWSDSETATAAAPRYDGLGFVVTAADPYTGADLDHARDPESGRIEPWAQAIIKRLDSYTEVTPSGAGLRVWTTATLPPGGRVKKKLGPDGTGAVELYDRGRYFTVTGQHVAGTPETIEGRQAEISALHAELFGVTTGPGPNGHGPSRARVDLDDAELLARARDAKNGAKFSALWAGDLSGYGSHSEADLALCQILAFWTGRDATRMDHLVRQSGLMRPKWDERRFGDGRTYGTATVARAIELCTEVYEPRPRPGRPSEADAAAGEASPKADAPVPLGIGGGAFLRRTYPPPSPIIEGLLSDEGGGWRGGEEKLGKSYEVADETLCLAFALPVLGRFAVPAPRRVLLVSEEDSPRRTWRRLRVLLRGHALDPTIRSSRRPSTTGCASRRGKGSGSTTTGWSRDSRRRSPSSRPRSCT